MQKILLIPLSLICAPDINASEVNIATTMGYVGLNKYVEVSAQRLGTYSIPNLTAESSQLVGLTSRNKLFTWLDVQYYGKY